MANSPMVSRDADFLPQRLDDLIKIGGTAKITEMLLRFAEQLDEFLQQVPTRGWPPMEVHRIVGLGAMLGFQRVEQTWQTIETATSANLADAAAALKAAQSAIDFCRTWPAQVASDGDSV